MNGYEILIRVSIVPYSFGALAFGALANSYWRERRSSRPKFLSVFTGALAAAFLLSVARLFEPPEAVGIAHDLVTGMLPPLLLNLIWSEEGHDRRWRWPIAGFYVMAAALSLAALSSDGLDAARPIVLGAAGVLGLAVQWGAPVGPLRLPNRVLLWLTVVSAGLNLGWPNPYLALIPDYLLLAFFAVALYYQERLAFFDILVKRGAFFAASLLFLSLFQPWETALLLAAILTAAPWLYDRLARAIDRVWLHRTYSAAEAERRFIGDAQPALTEQDLVARAEESLGRIFRARAHVRLGAGGPEIVLDDRPDGVPFLSDDRRLLQSLTRTLGVVVENVRFREREQQLRWLAGRAELKALRAQINPHFLFNALNAIAGLIHEQPALAEETVEHLAEVFRYTLRKSEKEWARLDEEMEFVAAYLRVEQARFGERLRVEVEIDPAARAVQVPAMSIQPLVENAIKHGVSAVERRGVVRIRAAMSSERLRVEVEDNGPGFANGAGEGHGLRNIAERLEGYYAGAATLGWENLREGARVWIEIPEGASARAHR